MQVVLAGLFAQWQRDQPEYQAREPPKLREMRETADQANQQQQQQQQQQTRQANASPAMHTPGPGQAAGCQGQSKEAALRARRQWLKQQIDQHAKQRVSLRHGLQEGLLLALASMNAERDGRWSRVRVCFKARS